MCHEGVHSVHSDDVKQEFLEAVPVGKKMLEIGTGHGGFISSLYLDRPGEIEHIMATDINPKAVANAKVNFSAYNIPAEVRLSDMFQNLEGETFDAIFWNPPYLYTEDEDLSMLERAVGDPDFRTLW